MNAQGSNPNDQIIRSAVIRLILGIWFLGFHWSLGFGNWDFRPMKVLVANLGSTSFKYRLFDMSNESQLARGGIDRIGQAASACFIEIGGRREETTQPVSDHAAAVRMCLDQLTHPEYGCLKSVGEV